ncbi:MAG: hypothetical protein WBN15_13970, partial [Polyangiales bacterium]
VKLRDAKALLGDPPCGVQVCGGCRASPSHGRSLRVAAGKGDFCGVGGSRGGTIAFANDQDSCDEARRRMEEHCGGAYTIVDERRVVVGQKTTVVAQAPQKPAQSSSQP